MPAMSCPLQDTASLRYHMATDSVVVDASLTASDYVSAAAAVDADAFVCVCYMFPVDEQQVPALWRSLAPQTSNRPATNQQPASNPPATNQQPTSHQPTSNQPSTYQQPTSNQAATYQQPSSNQPATNQQAASNQPATNQQPTSKQPATNQQPTSNQPALLTGVAWQLHVESDTHMPSRHKVCDCSGNTTVRRLRRERHEMIRCPSHRLCRR